MATQLPVFENCIHEPCHFRQLVLCNKRERELICTCRQVATHIQRCNISVQIVSEEERICIRGQRREAGRGAGREVEREGGTEGGRKVERGGWEGREIWSGGMGMYPEPDSQARIDIFHRQKMGEVAALATPPGVSEGGS